MIFTRKLLPIWSPVGWAAGRVCIGHITLFVSILVILISVLCDIYQEVVANMESCWLGCWKGLHWTYNLVCFDLGNFNLRSL